MTALTYILIKFDWNHESGMTLQLIDHCNAKTSCWI